MDEAYTRYAQEANQSATNLATFRAIAKKYPHKSAEEILRDLVAKHPGSEGKWFAAAKDAGLFDAAIDLATTSPKDPRTLIRAATDFADKRPNFAIACGMAALRWIASGYGYDILPLHVVDAYSAILDAANAGGIEAKRVKADIRDLIESSRPNSQFVETILKHHLSS